MALRVVLAPTSPAKMARRIAWAGAHQFADPSAVTAPALVVTGEPELDRVVPVEVTRALPRRLAGRRARGAASAPATSASSPGPTGSPVVDDFLKGLWMAHDFLREIPGPAGPLEALLDLPDGEPRAVAVFGHPHPLHGGTMHTKALYQAAKAMPRIGVAALRFNFRGVGRSAGTFDAGPGEKDDFKAAIAFVSERFPGPADLGRGHVVRIVGRA